MQPGADGDLGDAEVFATLGISEAEWEETISADFHSSPAGFESLGCTAAGFALCG